MQTLECDRLINDYLDYTGALAAGLMSEFSLHGVVGYDDVLGYATIGLTTAALRYQADRGAHFKTSPSAISAAPYSTASGSSTAAG